MQIEAKISARHVHLTEEDYKILFGEEEFLKRNDLSQPGEFASTVTVTLKTEKNMISGVRVLGPFRNCTQVEISRTDSFTLGLNPPVRDSGDLTDAATVTIIGKVGEVTRDACILASRHIHITPEENEKLGLGEKVSIKTSSPKPTIFEGVSVRVSSLYRYELHLDTDDGNAALLNQGDIVEITK